MRIASIAVLAIVVLLFAAWWLFIRAPGPTQLCEHVVEVTMTDTAERGLAPQTRARLVAATQAQCEQRAHDKLKLRGRIKYATWAKCMLAAEDVAGLGGC